MRVSSLMGSFSAEASESQTAQAHARTHNSAASSPEVQDPVPHARVFLDGLLQCRGIRLADREGQQLVDGVDDRHLHFISMGGAQIALK